MVSLYFNQVWSTITNNFFFDLQLIVVGPDFLSLIIEGQIDHTKIILIVINKTGVV